MYFKVTMKMVNGEKEYFLGKMKPILTKDSLKTVNLMDKDI